MRLFDAFQTLSKTGKRTDPFTGLPVVGEIRRNENLKERIKKFLQKENVMSTMGDVDVDVFMPDEADVDGLMARDETFESESTTK